MARTVIENVRIADVETGRLREGCSVLVESGVVRAIENGRIEVADAVKIDGGGRTLLPGLIDCKVRISSRKLEPNAWEAAETTGRFKAERVDDGRPHSGELGPTSLLEDPAALRTLADMKARGFTTVRDDRGADAGVQNAIDKGYVCGPKLLIAVEEIQAKDPHQSSTDEGRYRLKPQCECCRPPALEGELPDVAQVLSKSRTLLRLGADHLRVVMSRFDPRTQLPVDDTAMTTRAVALVVDEAASWGRYVSAVAHTPATIMRAADAGVRVVEYGTFLDRPAADMMAERGMFLIPCLLSHVRAVERAEALGVSVGTIDRLMRTVEASLLSLETARRAGVRIAFGSGLAGDEVKDQASELSLLGDILTEQEVILSATSTAAALLRLDQKIGVISTGAKAEFLLVHGDPLKEAACLQEARGARFRSLGLGLSC
jgi:imidazolonepropionase-like amidohydrolase